MVSSCLIFPLLAVQVLCSSTSVGSTNLQFEWHKFPFDHSTILPSLSDLLDDNSDNLKDFHVQEHATPAPGKVLLLCQCTFGNFFVAGILANGTDAPGNSYKVTGIGYYDLHHSNKQSDVTANTDALHHRNKVAAEEYADSVYAFKEVWERLKSKYFNAFKRGIPYDCYKDNVKIQQENPGFKLHFIWIQKDGENIVSVYKGPQGKAALLVFHLDGIFIQQTEFIRTHSLISAYKEVSSLIHSVQKNNSIFYGGWVPEYRVLYRHLTPQVEIISSWIPPNSGLTLSTVYIGKESVGTIYELPGTFPLRAFFVAWDICRKGSEKSYQLRHIGKLASVGESASLYRSFRLRQLSFAGLNVHQYRLGWYSIGGKKFECENKNRILEDIGRNIGFRGDEITLQKFVLLPDDPNYSMRNLAHENLCVVYQLHENYSFVYLQPTLDILSKLDWVKYQEVKFYDSQDDAINAAENKILIEYNTISMEWEPTADQKYYTQMILDSELLPAELSNIAVVQKWTSQSKKATAELVIVSYSEVDAVLETGFFFVSINKKAVTWIGINHQVENSERARALNQVKVDADSYVNRILAVDEKWTTVSNRIQEWKVSESQIVRLCSGTTLKFPGRVSYWFESYTIQSPDSEMALQLRGKDWSCKSQVMTELGQKLESPRLFNSPTDTDLDNSEKTSICKEARTWVDDYAQRNVITCTKTGFLGIICPIHKTSKNSLMGFWLVDSSGTEYTIVFPALHDGTTATILPPNIFLTRKGISWLDVASNVIMDPLTFVQGADWQNSRHDFTDSERDLIFEKAPWQIGEPKPELFCRSERNADAIRDGAKAYIISLGDDKSRCFFMAWNHDKNSAKRIKYIGGLGSEADAKDSYLQYILTPTRFQGTPSKNGIIWFLYLRQAETPAVVTELRKFLFPYIENVLGSKMEQKLIDEWWFGQIPAPAGNLVRNHVATYSILGKVPGGWISAIIQVQFLHGSRLIKSVRVSPVHQAHEQVNESLLEYMKAHHRFEQ